MKHLAVIDDAAAAEASLDPVRSRLLAELAEPSSATSLAARVGLSRQKVNYHLRALERHGLVELVHERRKGNLTERVMQPSGVLCDLTGGPRGVQPDPSRAPDRLSACWLIALAARLVRDVGPLVVGATKEASGSPRSPSTARSASPRRQIGRRLPRSCPLVTWLVANTTTRARNRVVTIVSSWPSTPA